MKPIDIEAPVERIWLDIASLRKRTLGEPAVCIAVLDGPVDLRHPCFAGAALSRGGGDIPPLSNNKAFYSHGTHVASVIFGRGSVSGIAPKCRGFLVNIFGNRASAKGNLCSQSYLAHAINLAIHHGANIISISGGQLARLGAEDADPLLVHALENCAASDVLVIAAAGNDGCACEHIPAALPGVLAVGALGNAGLPLESSNWGNAYRRQGIFAPGANILGAAPGGGINRMSGTSFATPIVAGVAALLMSRQYMMSGKVDASAVYAALIEGSQPCRLAGDTYLSQKCMAGVIDVDEAENLIAKTHSKERIMSDFNELDSEVRLGYAVQDPSILNNEVLNVATGIRASSNDQELISPSADAQRSSASAAEKPAESNQSAESCSTCNGPQLVYALGELSIEFKTDSSRKGFGQALNGGDIRQYLREHPDEASSVHWVLSLDGTAIYVINPVGPFAHVLYQKMIDFILDDEIERISIPGYSIERGSVTLLSGEQVPMLVPAERGIFSWSTKALLDLVVDGKEDPGLRDHVEDFLNRIYHDFRNAGSSPRERALNYAATNLFQAVDVLKRATEEGRVLENIKVEKSVLDRSGEDLYDVKLRFFDPDNVLRARRVFRFTVDVSDVVPISVGQVRAWSEA
ncbi:PatA/PatG family cyanobactin maturation protease [Trinickia sp. NRRL B-1857]|uniref:PatA/PatG family cyanobactin maturation protease n=1 Tax=Trinickia sp. NRRL B-1857 TaxID=3162879 RepID=UPI003D29979C